MANARTIRWTLDKALKGGKDALALLEKYGPSIADRLPAGLGDGLKSDLPRLEAAKTGRPVIEQEGISRTGTERAIAEAGVKLLGPMRESLREHLPKGDPILKAVGVGRIVNPKVTTAVVSALSAMIKVAKENPDVFRAAGIADRDLAKCGSIRDQLPGADEAQETTIRGKHDFVRDARAVQKRVEDAVLKVSNAGKLEFVDDPETAKRFAALAPSAPAAPKGKPAAKPAA